MRVLVLVVSLLSALACFGQTAASLQGTVSDPSGAVVPKVQVEVRNVATAALYTATTDEAGRYLWPDRKSTRLNSSHIQKSRMPSSA